MSIIGTGIAAGVANANTTARTQAANSSGREAQRADSAEQTDKFTLSQLHDAGATRATDQELPDQQALGYEQMYEGDAQQQEEENPNDQIHEADAPASSPSGVLLPPTYDPVTSDMPLFHAINLKA